jgi:hypothetical protein
MIRSILRVFDSYRIEPAELGASGDRVAVLYR